MTLLSIVASVSKRVSQTSSRLAKVRELRIACTDSVRTKSRSAIAYLSGETRQGNSGVSHAAFTRPALPLPRPILPELAGRRHGISELASMRRGRERRKSPPVEALLRRATAEEQSFLMRLIVGELRQGALQALVLEAVAAAAGVALEAVRKAAMSAGGLGEGGRLCWRRAPRIGAFFRSVDAAGMPMLSQSAPDTGRRYRCSGPRRWSGSSMAPASRFIKAPATCAVYTEPTMHATRAGNRRGGARSSRRT